jgi:stage IV sporulation protein FB
MWCGAQVEQYRLGPFGMMARARKMDNLHPRLRLCVYAAGPLVNLAVAWWAFTVHYLSYVGVFWLRDLAFYNLALASFNLLPVLPLDGGRIAQHFLGNMFGALRANRFLLRSGRMAAAVLVLLGFVQIAFFSYNITLLCVAVFLWRKNNSLKTGLRLETFLFLQKKPVSLRGERGKKKVKTKTLTVPCHLPVARALDRLGWSFFRAFRIRFEDNQYITVNETTLLSYVFSAAGINGAAILHNPVGALANTAVPH